MKVNLSSCNLRAALACGPWAHNRTAAANAVWKRLGASGWDDALCASFYFCYRKMVYNRRAKLGGDKKIGARVHA